MKIKALKNLIIFSSFAFALFSCNHVFAYVPGVWDYQPRIQTNEPAFTQVPMGVDYYYQASVPVAKANNANNQTVTPKITTKTTDNISTTNTDKINGNNLTALSLAGSGGFMPSSIWQWMLVVFLILVIVIMARLFVKKPEPHNLHAMSAH
jgi:hypothetical protein